MLGLVVCSRSNRERTGKAGKSKKLKTSYSIEMKKIYTILGVCILLLVLTNPPLSEFKDYKSSNYIDETSEREVNFLIASVYKRKFTYLIDNGTNKHINRTYLGILGNFFLLQENKEK